MRFARHSLLTRPDTFFGVCEGLGQDFGIHANVLRLAFAGFLFWNPAAAVLTYATIGAVVAIVRFLVPDPILGEPQAKNGSVDVEGQAPQPEPVRQDQPEGSNLSLAA